MKQFKYLIASLIMIICTLFGACSDDKEDVMPAGVGEIEFLFSKVTVYEITSLSQIASIKVRLEKDGEVIEMPSLNLEGDSDTLLTTAAVRYAAGIYRILSYKAYDNTGAFLTEISFEKDNEIEIVAGQRAVFNFPLKFKTTLVGNSVKNTLLGILYETFGSDSLQWPDYVPNWRASVPVGDWENLEFNYDDYGYIASLSSVHFDEKFKGMKRIPEFISNLVTIESLIIRNLDLEELPESINSLNIETLVMTNTKLKKFPTTIDRSTLRHITIVNSELDEIPDVFGKMELLATLHLIGNKITEIPQSLLENDNLNSLVISDTEIEQVPDNIFEKLWRVSTFDFSDNKKLSRITAQVPTTRSDMRGLFLDGCAFTEIPDIARKNPVLRTLRMDNNKLTSFAASDIAEMSNLSTLSLNGNKFASFPKLESNTLCFLSLNYCGFTQLPDLSGLPALGKFYCWGNGFTAFPEGYFDNNPNLKEARLTPFASGEFGGYPYK